MALEMALGALAHSRGTVALAVTGIAGPSGGTPTKPVGTVCFAWAPRAARRAPRRDAFPATARRFAGNRSSVRLQGVLELLDEG